VITRPDGRPFIVIGENLHASRVVRHDGPRMGRTDDGRPAIRVPGSGPDRLLPVPEVITDTTDFRQGQVKHVMAALRHGIDGSAHAGLAADYLRWMAARQVAGGADYLDVNVDEISDELEPRLAAMAWAVGEVGPTATVPLSLDSSDPAVIDAGLASCDRSWAGGAALLLNSASLERIDVLDAARAFGAAAVLSASGDVSMPSTAEERIDHALAIVAEARSRGIAPGMLHVDALVVPIGVDPEAGNAFLEAVRRLRASLGPEIHLTGGLSNASFGLPARRLLGEVFLDLAAQAGLDSGIVDPVAADIGRALAPDRGSEAYRMAADFIEGRDAFGMEFIDAFRAGRLGAGPG
jgi:5-methyltetrahydrofolate--homocysteine methyltransferase